MGAVSAFGPYAMLALLAPLLAGSYMYLVVTRSALSTRKHTESVEFIGAPQYLGYVLLLSFMFLFGILPFVLLGLLKT
jgi:hypothetical protein